MKPGWFNQKRNLLEISEEGWRIGFWKWAGASEGLMAGPTKKQPSGMLSWALASKSVEESKYHYPLIFIAQIGQHQDSGNEKFLINRKRNLEVGQSLYQNSNASGIEGLSHLSKTQSSRWQNWVSSLFYF